MKLGILFAGAIVYFLLSGARSRSPRDAARERFLELRVPKVGERYRNVRTPGEVWEVIEASRAGVRAAIFYEGRRVQEITTSITFYNDPSRLVRT